MILGAIPNVLQSKKPTGGGVVKEYYKIPSSLFPEFTAQIWNEGGSDVYTDYDFDATPKAINANYGVSPGSFLAGAGYVDLNGPINGNGTFGSPFNTMSSCNASSYNVFYVKGRGRQSNSSATWTKNAMVLAWIGFPPPELTTQTNTDLVWVQNGSNPLVYDAAWPSASGFINTVMDRAVLDGDGCYVGYNSATSIATVAAAAGRFWYDSANNTLRVRTIDGRVPDSNIVGLIGVGGIFSHSASIASPRYFFAEGLILAGGSTSANFGNAGAGVLFPAFNSCKFLCAGGTEASTYMTGRTQGYFRNCKSFYHRDDVFDYNSTSSSLFIEWYCKGGRHTWAGSSINASTSHESSRVIRIKCDYQDTAGKCLQDITNSKSWNLRINTGFPRATTPNDYPYASNSTASGLTEMYLIECTRESTKGYYNFANSIMNIYDGTVGNLLTATNQNFGTLNTLNKSDVYV